MKKIFTLLVLLFLLFVPIILIQNTKPLYSKGTSVKTSGVYYFFSDDCIACRSQKDELNIYIKQTGTSVVGIENNPENEVYFERYNITNVPTIIKLEEGKVIENLVGVHKSTELNNEL